ncbi:hypothetical protein TNCV_2948991 [Trichonephila clavipes]|nr:hypothetical protein TNCV_2948991 [Trichonephila clavipes]
MSATSWVNASLIVCKVVCTLVSLGILKETTLLGFPGNAAKCLVGLLLLQALQETGLSLVRARSRKCDSSVSK